MVSRVLASDMDFVNIDFINAWHDTKLLLTLLIYEASLEFVSQIL